MPAVAGRPGEGAISRRYQGLLPTSGVQEPFVSSSPSYVSMLRRMAMIERPGQGATPQGALCPACAQRRDPNPGVTSSGIYERLWPTDRR
jgi:hypothetical protein